MLQQSFGSKSPSCRSNENLNFTVSLRKRRLPEVAGKEGGRLIWKTAVGSPSNSEMMSNVCALGSMSVFRYQNL